jgi:hypothetical protein
MDEATYKKANQILLRFVTDIEGKLRYGARIRLQMHETLNRGEDPNNYRSEFIAKASTELFGWLALKAEEFNELYPHDRMSSEDFSDILATAQFKLSK